MEELLPEGWRFTKRQKQILGYGSAGAALLYFFYKAYKSDSLAAVVELRERLQRSLDASSKSLLTASEFSSRITQDLQDFLTSDSDELPQSLRQLAKLAKSKEASEAASSLAAAAARGVFSTPQPTPVNEEEEGHAPQEKPDLLERVLSLLTTDRGANLVQLAVSVACRSTVKAYCESNSNKDQGPSFWQQLLEFGATERGEKLYANCVGTFVREGTKVWMSSLEGVSGWEDLLSSLCKPERQAAVDRMTRTFVNELVVSYLKRSRHNVRSGAKIAVPTGSKSQLFSAAEAVRAPNEFMKGVKGGDPPEESLVVPKQVAVSSTRPHAEWTSALVEAAQNPDARSLILSVTRTAAGEGVRTSIFATRDMLFGVPREPPYAVTGQHLGHVPAPGDVSLQQMSTRNLGTLLLFIFMPIIMFLAGRRAALG